MADNRTEKPTAKRRSEARKKGQIPRSPDLTSAAVLIGGILAMIVTAPTMLERFADVLRVGLSQSGNTHLAARGGLGSLASWATTSMLGIAAPVVITAAAAGLVANLVQHRPGITAAAVKPQWSRINPQAGLRRLLRGGLGGGAQGRARSAMQVGRTPPATPLFTLSPSRWGRG